MEYKCYAKCSQCEVEFICNSKHFPIDCGICEQNKVNFVDDIKTLTNKKNKLNRKISTLKKEKPKKDICVNCGKELLKEQEGVFCSDKCFDEAHNKIEEMEKKGSCPEAEFNHWLKN